LVYLFSKMNYIETVQYLFNQLPMFQRIGAAAYKAGLDNTKAMDLYFDHPHRKFKTIHVAGTNGKGSTSHSLAAVLQKAGYKTGLYTSPHLLDFRERIRVNGQMISEQFVINFVDLHKSFFEKLQPSFFELTVALAFEYFAHEQVDVAVIEVGMGGRLDSTNIISPLVSVITNISLDHTQFLGESLAKIAAEKGGIIKENIPVVIGQRHPETIPVFNLIAENLDAPLIQAEDIYTCNTSTMLPNGKQQFYIEKNAEPAYPGLASDLAGMVQRMNICTILITLDVLINKGLEITEEAILTGISETAKLTGLRGRWEMIHANPKIICDTGHNQDGISHTMQQLKHTPYRKLHMVFGMVSDKSPHAVLQLLPTDAIYYLTRASIPRAMPVDELEKCASAYLPNRHLYLTVKDALQAAMQEAQPNDVIFVGGSTFVVADALEYWENAKIK